MLRAVQQTIKKRQLLKKGDHVLIAVSGGADSVSLTYLLHYLSRRYKLTLTLAHLNHRIRGRDADEDARFVRDLSWRLGLPCVQAGIDVPAKAKKSGISLEMAAREARYDFLARVVKDAGADCLATAHTADDQVETILLKLARGAGPQGLGGIPYVSEQYGVRVIRPMRDVTHDEVVRFLESHRLRWREDPSNKDLQFLRNRVRHEVIPFLEKNLNPQLHPALLRTGDVLREENEWLNKHAEKLLKRCQAEGPSNTLVVETVNRQALAIRRRVLRLWLLSAGMPAERIDFDCIERIEQLLLSSRGTRVTPLSGSLEVVRRYGILSLQRGARATEAFFNARIVVPGESIIPDAGLRVVTKFDAGVIKQTGARVGDLPAKASLDINAIGDSSIFVRSWAKGDRIKPLGFTGTRKLQDVFVDQKVARDRRAQIPVFECRGEIIWVPGYRVARGWEVRDPAGPSLHLYVHPL